MLPVTIQGLTKRFASVLALDHIDLEIRAGEIFFLLGPSGCGKTTLLRSIAGFCAPDSGKILFGEMDVTSEAPNRRNTGMVFQNYALWPHKTVGGNVSFGLEEQRLPNREVRQRVAEALASVQMSELADRRINQLSGGQQQRVALARALVVRPRCLLLDEPLSNLDAKLRTEMRLEIRSICRKFGLTSIYVTHDQKEALSVADRLAVMEKGKIRQVGAPEQVYRSPLSRFVADFIGDSNFIAGTVDFVEGGNACVATDLGKFSGRVPPGASPLSKGDKVFLSIRPECFTLQDHSADCNSIAGTIGEAIYSGSMAEYRFLSASSSLRIAELNPSAAGRGVQTSAFAVVSPRDVLILAE